MSDFVYLDHNATTPVFPEAREKLAHVLAQTGNPSSLHAFGRNARREVEEARERIAALVNVSPGEVVFTSGGTEANTLALMGCGRPIRLVSAVEHESVRRCASDQSPLPVLSSGVVDLEALERCLKMQREPVVVSIALADGQTGVIQPVREVAAIAHRHGALVHCDAVQAAGRIPTDFRKLGVDLLTLSAHKIGGPQGVGALIVSPAVDLFPLMPGGGQERGRRGGTENVAAIAGFGVAAERIIPYIISQELTCALRDKLEARIKEENPDVCVFGQSVERVGNTSCFALPGVKGRTQVMRLDLAGVAVSAGSACSSGKLEPPHSLLAMGVSEEEADCAIRVSFGWTSKKDDIDRFMAAWRPMAAGKTA